MYKLSRFSFTTDKLEIKNNHLKPGDFKLNPSITRKTGKINDKTFFTALVLSIKSDDDKRFPIDVFVDFRGIFEFSEFDDEESVMTFLKTEAVQIMFPYLRTIVSNLTTSAMLPPIILPIADISKMFKDDKEAVYIS